MKKVLIVIDMQEGFCVAGNPLYIGPGTQTIIPFIQQKIDESNQRNEPVIFTGDFHAEDDKEFRMFPRHCVTGTREVEIIPELKDRAKQSLLIKKTRYSAFFGTQLAEKLEKIAPDEIEMVGVCTNICVFFTCEELRNRDYSVTIFRKGVASFDESAHEHALQQMETVLGAAVE